MRRGTACVEFALVAPLLIFLLLAMVEVGRAIQVQQVLTNAVREGARAYAEPANTEDDVKDAVNAAMGNIKVLPAITCTTDGSAVTVAAALPFQDVAYFKPFIIRSNLTAYATFRKQTMFVEE